MNNGNIVVETPIPDDLDSGMEVFDIYSLPVPYVYDETNERVVHLTNQVIDFCGYQMTEIPQNPDEEPGVAVPLAEEGEEDNGEADIDDPVAEPYPEQTDELDKLREEYQAAVAKNLEERKELWPKIWQAIRYLSNLACWTDGDNDTFLTQLRHQTYSTVAQCACRPYCCECDKNVLMINLDYNPVPDKPFGKAVLTAVYGGEILRETIDNDYLNDHYDRSTNTLYISRRDFPNLLLDKGGCCCMCEHRVTVELEYLAGYDDIPDGLLTLICPIIAKINEAKIGMSSCHQAMTQVAGLLKRKKSGNVEYEWSTVDTDSQKTQTMYTELYDLALMDELMAISRCYMLEAVEEMGDVI